MMNRRELLGSAAAISMLPAMPAVGSVAGSSGAPAFEAMLRLGPAQRGAGNHRWARIVEGSVTGDSLVGLVQSGRLDWHVDPASGAVEAAVHCQVHCVDGRMRELRRHGLQATSAGQGRVRLETFPLI